MIHFHNPLQGMSNVLHGNLPWNSPTPPPSPPTQGTGAITQNPLPIYTQSPQNQTSVQLQSLTGNRLQQPRGFNFELPNYPQINPQGVETYGIPINPRPEDYWSIPLRQHLPVPALPELPLYTKRRF